MRGHVEVVNSILSVVKLPTRSSFRAICSDGCKPVGIRTDNYSLRTGYVSRDSENPGGNLTAELRGVNDRSVPKVNTIGKPRLYQYHQKTPVCSGVAVEMRGSFLVWCFGPTLPYTQPNRLVELPTSSQPKLPARLNVEDGDCQEGRAGFDITIPYPFPLDNV